MYFSTRAPIGKNSQGGATFVDRGPRVGHP